MRLISGRGGVGGRWVLRQRGAGRGRLYGCARVVERTNSQDYEHSWDIVFDYGARARISLLTLMGVVPTSTLRQQAAGYAVHMTVNKKAAPVINVKHDVS